MAAKLAKKNAEKALAARKLRMIPRDPLNDFVKAANDDPTLAIQMLFWRNRFVDPEFMTRITPEDLKGFEDCVGYLKVRPVIKIHRPEGLPAQEARPASGNRRAVPGRAASPPRDFVVVQMVDGRNGYSFKPIENNEEDRDRQMKADDARRGRDRARVLADALYSDMQQGQFSTANITDAIQVLRAYGAMPT